MLTSVSVIVPAKNEEKVIGNCIESLLNLDYPEDKLEIIVSIDDSTDKTLEICKEYEPRVKVIESSPKKCKAEALNEVLPSAKGEIIGIYDADCIVERNCLKEVMKHFSNKDIAGVSGLIKSYNKNKSLIAKSLSLETCFVSFSEYFINKLGANAHFFGKNMFIRKNILEKIGGFDEYTFLEDTELSVRMKRLGYKVIFEPEAITWHEEPENFRSFLRQRSRISRGALRLKKLKTQKNLKDWLSDLMHGMNYYFSPFGLIIATILLLAYLFGIPYIFFVPILILFAFNILMIIYSRIFYKESLKDLIFMPIWFLLTNFYCFICFPKAYIDEKRNKNIKWNKVERSNYEGLGQLLGSYR